MSKLKIKQKILIDTKLKEDLLDEIGIARDTEDYLIDKATKERVLSLDGKYIYFKDFGGIMKGSTIFLKSDIDSVFKLAEKTLE